MRFFLGVRMPPQGVDIDHGECGITFRGTTIFCVVR
jgi:hypothetical protein